MDESLKAWFAREILVHEAALVRYLHRVWSRTDEVHDLRQDIYIRVYEAASVAKPVSPRAFLFSTARHLLIDRLRRRRIVSIDTVGNLDDLNVLIDDLSPERILRGHQDLRQLALAFDDLPPRCREVVWMRRVGNLSRTEVARRLGISPKTAEIHLTRGLMYLTDALFGRKPLPKTHTNGGSDHESEHGQQTD
jgi:RNA polymerase sigma factor (sigma-70 family)